MAGTPRGEDMIEHYCQKGKWVKGKRKDCPEPKHNVNLQKKGTK